MTHFRANGLNIVYELHGRGDPVLLLHGFGGTGHSDWRYQIEPLAEQFQVIVVDIRGHGRTDHPETIRGPDFFETATSDMVELLLSLNCGPAHVCGFSMGSSIAAWICLANPSLVRSLILVSAAARVNRDIAPDLFDLWESMREPERMDSGWVKTLARLHGEERWRMLLSNYSAAVIARVESDEDIVYSRGGDIGCPVLIVQGSDDSVSPVLLAEELYTVIPDSELLMLRSDHWVPGLLPDRFNKGLLEFLHRRFPPQAPE